MKRSISGVIAMVAASGLAACANVPEIEEVGATSEEARPVTGDQSFKWLESGCLGGLTLDFGPRPATLSGGATHAWSYAFCDTYAAPSTRSIVLVDPRATLPSLTLYGSGGQIVQASQTTATYNGNPMIALVAEVQGPIAAGTSFRAVIHNNGNGKLPYYFVVR